MLGWVITPCASITCNYEEIWEMVHVGSVQDFDSSESQITAEGNLFPL